MVLRWLRVRQKLKNLYVSQQFYPGERIKFCENNTLRCNILNQSTKSALAVKKVVKPIVLSWKVDFRHVKKHVITMLCLHWKKSSISWLQQIP